MAAGELSPNAPQLWPFGKYQGKPIDRVLADHSYLEWVLNQPWFIEDYGRLHALITNFGNESQDSPEHNAFQIQFLEDSARLAVARRLGYGELDGDVCRKQKAIAKRVGKELDCRVEEQEVQLRVSPVRFEERGWDVAFDILPASYVAWLDAKESGKAYVDLLDGWGKPKLAERNRSLLKANRGSLDVAVYEPTRSGKVRVFIELKPDLGDDYPGVLRQIQRYAERDSQRGGDWRERVVNRARSGGAERKLLIVRRARFTSVTLEQVRAFFASADVLLILESELELNRLEAPAEDIVDAEIVLDEDDDFFG